MDSISASPSQGSAFRYLVILLAVTGAAVGLIAALSVVYSASATAYWPGYNDMVSSLPSPIAWLRWVVGDISEVAFYKHEFASIGLLLGGAFGYWTSRYARNWQGFSIAYGTGLWPWLVTSSLLGLLLSNLLWGWTLTADSWQPTFAAFVSLPAAMVLLFGGGWRVTLNGALLGAVLVTPSCLLFVNYLCIPLGLPAVIGNVLGMALGSVVAFLLCRALPILVSRRPESTIISPPPKAVNIPDYSIRWTFRRVLADFSEAPFFGNEWASLGLILGVFLAYALNPLSPAYGSGWLPQLVAGQALTSLLGILLWRREWQKSGWYPTYVPLVAVVPAAILVHGGSPFVIVGSALLGALIAPPLACAIAGRLPKWMHPYIGNVLAMATSTALIVPVIGFLATN
ncbi:hypothetical protein DYL59_19530 [Pseudomonas kairouanensis]|uniref:Uncharacterized protein n=1 Tax=Pseudomonas kairouanensis TaxID=2293832 RepID=A0A4Z0ALC6_9PSED|nr:hypothetical protein [Pseudomonas kairouanensis]TFY87173.1 hypothetical protein DYL59_19530 [Pseudomonas kairouanensis]